MANPVDNPPERAQQQAQSLQQVLALSTANTRSPTAALPRENDAAWLREALEHHSRTGSAVPLVKTLLGAAADASRPEEERSESLIELVEEVEHDEHAATLGALGLWPQLLQLATAGTETPVSVRANAAWAIGAACQHNEVAQAQARDAGAIEALVASLGVDSAAPVQTKTILALGALLRHCPPSMAAFERCGGFPAIIHVLVNAAALPDTEVLVTKVVFFLKAVLCDQDSGLDHSRAVRGWFDAGLGDALVAAVGRHGSGDDPSSEQLCSIVGSLLQAALGDRGVSLSATELDTLRGGLLPLLSGRVSSGDFSQLQSLVSTTTWDVR